MKNLLTAVAVASVLTSASAVAQTGAPASEISLIRQQLEVLLQRVDRLEQQNATLATENAELKAASDEGDAEREYLKSQTQDLRKESAAANVTLSGLRGAEWAQRITFKGDLRYRHEEIWDDTRTANGTLATADRVRDRIRLRAGFDARPTDNIMATVQFSTAELGDPRSPNQTLDGTYARKELTVDQAYFDWKFTSWGNLLGGKMRQPYVRPGQSVYFIDNDLSPEGLALQFNRGIWFGSVYGTWIDEVSGPESANTSDTLLNGAQVGVRMPVGTSTLMLAAHYYDLAAGQGRRGFYNCTATSNSCANGNTTTGAAGLGVLTYDFNVINLAAQFNTTLGGLPLQMWGEYAQNQDPDDLDTAWNVGVMYGAAANYRTWEASATYQVVEKDALFGQLVDSDFGGGATDSQGFILRAGYAPIRNWIFNATYFINERNVDVGTKADYNRLQVDMNMRF